MICPAGWNGAFSQVAGTIPESQLFTFVCTIGMPCRAGHEISAEVEPQATTEALSSVLLSNIEQRERDERSSSVSVSGVVSLLDGMGLLVILRGLYLPPLLNFVSELVCLLPRSSFSMKKKRQKVIQGDTP